MVEEIAPEIEKNFPLFYEYNRKRTWAPQTVLYDLDPVIYERWNLKKRIFLESDKK